MILSKGRQAGREVERLDRMEAVSPEDEVSSPNP